MPPVPITDRARRYLATIPVAISGSGGHDATFYAACCLVKGFDLSVSQAKPLLAEWNTACQPPWTDADLEYKLNSADRSSDGKRRGYLLANDEGYGRGDRAQWTDSGGSVPDVPAVLPPPKPELDMEKLRAFAGDWSSKVDLLWLADRSALDPALVDAEGFLRALYSGVENVLVFTDDNSQGQALWPDQKVPTRGPRGVWFLAQPVDGQYHPNTRVIDKKTGQPRKSRRSLESCLNFRYMIVESDKAPFRLWLGALAQLPLKIAAVYTSGSKSIHALVRVDCFTKADWDAEKVAMKHGLVTLGADPKSLSAVRLTRLPGCWRGEKNQWQKLLYLQPNPQLRPLIDLPVIRETEDYWCGQAANGVADSDEGGGEWIKSGLKYYSTVSKKCREALEGMM